MAKTIINATDARNDFFNMIDLVAKTSQAIYISKDMEIIVKMEPVEEKKDIKDIEKTLKATFGSLPSFPDVTKFRRSRQKSFSL